jgi:hypothetical protein
MKKTKSKKQKNTDFLVGKPVYLRKNVINMFNRSNPLEGQITV